MNLSVSFLEDAPVRLSREDFAKRAGVSTKTVDRWMHGEHRKGRRRVKGWLPHGKIGRAVVIVRDEAKTALLMRSPGNI